MTLIYGDCSQKMDKLIVQGIKVDTIITDPPYGVNFKHANYDDSYDFVKKESVIWLEKMYDILKDGGHCYIFTGTLSLPLWLENITKSKFIFKNIINVKAFCNGQYLKNNFYFRTEHIIFLHKGKGKRLNKVDFIPTSESWLKDKRNKNPKPYTYSYPNLWENIFVNYKKNKKNKYHPNEKNIELIEILVKLSSKENEIILDPFMGSGTTGLSCKNLNRQFIGIELNEEYFKIAKKRLLHDKDNRKLFNSK